MSNRDLYNQYLSTVNAAKADFIKKHIPEPIEKFFKPTRKGDVITYDVEGVFVETEYCRDWFPKYKDGERITAERLERAWKYVENMPEYSVDCIRVRYKYKMVGSSCSGAERLKDLTHKNGYYFTLHIAASKADELKLIYGERDGCVPCSYCGKQVLLEDTVKHKIYVRRAGSGKMVEFSYCSGKCGGNDQMAHEG